MDRDEISAVVKANIRAIVEGARGKQILESNSMRDFGADSLEIVEIVSRSARQLNLRVPRSALLSVSNIGELVDAFWTAASRQPLVA